MDNGKISDDPDFLAPTREGALIRERLAEEVNAALDSNDRREVEELEKRSFFLKRLREMRQKEERRKALEKATMEENKATEEEEIRRRRERLAAAIAPKNIVPIVSDEMSNNSNFVDVESWLPADRAQIDDDLWRDLPPEIQWDLRQHFRRCGNDASSGTKPMTKNAKCPKTTDTRKGQTSGRGRSTCANSAGSTNRRLTDYFERS